jgi:hypothetical protein
MEIRSTKQKVFFINVTDNLLSLRHVTKITPMAAVQYHTVLHHRHASKLVLVRVESYVFCPLYCNLRLILQT